MAYGAPVWHASIHGVLQPMEELRALAHGLLSGVGDAQRGTWEESHPSRSGGTFLHIRRCVSAEEERRFTGPAIDIRGTPEYAKRVKRIKKWMPNFLLVFLPHSIP